MAFFFHTYNTPDQARKTWARAKNNQIKAPDRDRIAAITDNDRLFSYALLKDAETARAAAMAITDPRAIHMLTELRTNNHAALKGCALNPCRDRVDLLPIMQQLPDRDRKEIIEGLADQEELLEMALQVPGQNAKLLALSRLTGPVVLEHVILNGGLDLLDKALKRFQEEIPDSQRRLTGLLDVSIGKKSYDRAGAIRERIGIIARKAEQCNQDEQLLEIDDRIVACLDKELTNREGMTHHVFELLDSITTQECLYSFARTARFELYSLHYVGYGYDLAKTRKKYEDYEEEKRHLIKAAVRKLDEDLMVQLAGDAEAAHLGRRYAYHFIQDEEKLTDLFLNHQCTDFKAMLEHVNNPENLRKIAAAMQHDSYGYEDVINKLARTPEGLCCLEDFLRQDVERDVLNLRLMRCVQDENTLYDLLSRYPCYHYIRNLCEIFLEIAENADHIADALKQHECSFQSAVRKISDASILRDVALHAKSRLTRSHAAKRLLELGLDEGHVQVTHDVCPYCGGQVRTTRILAGTIEAHNYYECTQCGYSAHQTLLGNSSETVFGDYYIYVE